MNEVLKSSEISHKKLSLLRRGPGHKMFHMLELAARGANLSQRPL